ncbi:MULTISPECIES: PPOX class F420-dependent oxidoreductase [unclassified Streptomyces]|uniref:PPOX class F420-dependent oxidoreductase n=1 Tax=unclassified Streptomyces TaxID=2593676 RepID=UPI00224E9C0B|nr:MULTISPECIES: PPOX class F420-dependent oxidoreductase [unclassified Streptomyces]MCX4628747.1 PPOX class F420-dependent oxidoreductase [Streptomyces sp. NBC_01443]WSW44765.1 PPOX class F420-dependent oxidoreductase [Streptomyces sp. NBC_01001]
MTIELNETVRGLLDSPHPAVLSTLNPDGSPQSSVVWVARDGADVLVSTEQGRRKERNIARDGRVGLTVFDTANPFLYVEIRGTATLAEDAGREVAIRISEQYLGPGAGKEYAEAPSENVRVVVRITPTKVLGNAAKAG